MPLIKNPESVFQFQVSLPFFEKSKNLEKTWKNKTAAGDRTPDRAQTS